MEFFVISLVAFFVLALVAGIIESFGGRHTFTPPDVTAPGRALQRKFMSLGDMRGMTRARIEAVAGTPNSFGALGGNQILLQWMATGYHIALVFEDDICQGITSEFAASDHP